MTTTSDGDDAQGRRMNLRRARTGGAGGGFGSGVSTRTESYNGADADDDSDDDLIDPRNDVVEPVNPATSQMLNNTLSVVDNSGSASYSREYRLQLMHRMLMRNVSLTNIAQELRVSISTAEKMRAELKAMLRRRAANLNIDEMIGEQMGLYDEVQGLALRMASASPQQTPQGSTGSATSMVRLAAMRTALAANADRTRFLTNAGVFDVMSYRRVGDAGEVSSVQMLMMQTEEMLNAIQADPTSTGAAPPKVLRRRKNGFKPLQFKDDGGSSGDNEVQEL